MSTQRSLNVLITGGARGIGRGLVRHFFETGNRVYVLDSDKDELKNELFRKWAAVSPNLYLRTCDLSDRAQIKTEVKSMAEAFGGKLDVLINNAFPTPHVWTGERTMEDESEDIMAEWDIKIAVGLTAPFLLSRLCTPLLQAGGTESSPGCIINVSSTRAYQSELDHEAYSAAKAGLLGLTHSMAVSLGHRYKIRVNAVIPGWIHVNNENRRADREGIKWEDHLTREDMEWHPVGRVGKVEDVVKAVEYLVGAEFVTGQEVTIDGGVGRKMVYPE